MRSFLEILQYFLQKSLRRIWGIILKIEHTYSIKNYLTNFIKNISGLILSSKFCFHFWKYWKYWKSQYVSWKFYNYWIFCRRFWNEDLKKMVNYFVILYIWYFVYFGRLNRFLIFWFFSNDFSRCKNVVNYLFIFISEVNQVKWFCKK